MGHKLLPVHIKEMQFEPDLDPNCIDVQLLS